VADGGFFLEVRSASCFVRSPPVTPSASRPFPGVGKRTAERIIVELREERSAGEIEGDGRRRRTCAPATRIPDRSRRARGLLKPRLHAGPRRRSCFSAAEGETRRGKSCSRRCAAPRGQRRHEASSPARASVPPVSRTTTKTEVVHPRCSRRRCGRRLSTARLRPPTLEDFVNQVQVTEQLGIFIEGPAAPARGGGSIHVLLAGPPGLGKTSLAYIIAAELNVPMVQTAGPALERKADIAAFPDLRWSPEASFFIDEIHRLGRAVEETPLPRRWRTGGFRWCSVRGPAARTVTLDPAAVSPSSARTTPHRPADDSAAGTASAVSHRLEHYEATDLRVIVPAAPPASSALR